MVIDFYVEYGPAFLNDTREFGGAWNMFLSTKRDGRDCDYQFERGLQEPNNNPNTFLEKFKYVL
jgi:hypothetical protein